MGKAVPYAAAALFGLALTLFGVPYVVWTLQQRAIDHEARNVEARSRDKTESLSSSGCGSHALKNIAIEDRALRLDEAVNLKVILENGEKVDCTAQVSLNAATFKISPASPQNVELPAGKVTILPWNIVPTKPGKQEITFTSGLSTFEKGFDVEDPTLIPNGVLKIASGLLAILGPIATLPWWIERRKKNRDAETEAAAALAAERQSRIIMLDSDQRTPRKT